MGKKHALRTKNKHSTFREEQFDPPQTSDVDVNPSQNSRIDF